MVEAAPLVVCVTGTLARRVRTCLHGNGRTCTIPSESKCSMAVYDQEKMTALTGGACQLTGLPDPDIQVPVR
jgi:hypothetical protein